MANFSVKLGDSTIDLTAAGDLGGRLRPDLSALFRLSDELARAGSTPLADLPPGVLETTFKTDQEAKWDLDGVNLSLSFKPTATGSITITKAGELFSYNQGDDPGKKVSVTVPEGQVYISIGLKVGLAVSGAASFSSNGFGVKASVSDADEFDVINHKCFPATTAAAEAVPAAFRAFVLPFKASGVDGLNDSSDYIDFDFVGKLALGIGVNYGFSGLLLGGRSGGEIKASFENNKLGKAVLKAKPTFRASASFSVVYDHEDAFRVVVGRHRTEATGVNGASLYLFRTDRSRLATEFTAGVTLSANAKFDATPNIDNILEKAAKAAAAKLPADLQGAASSALSAGLKRAEGKIDGFVNTINDKVNGLLQKATAKRSSYN